MFRCGRRNVSSPPGYNGRTGPGYKGRFGHGYNGRNGPGYNSYWVLVFQWSVSVKTVKQQNSSGYSMEEDPKHVYFINWFTFVFYFQIQTSSTHNNN